METRPTRGMWASDREVPNSKVFISDEAYGVAVRNGCFPDVEYICNWNGYWLELLDKIEEINQYTVENFWDRQ